MNTFFSILIILLIVINPTPYLLIILIVIFAYFKYFKEKRFTSALCYSGYDNYNESNMYIFYNWKCNEAFEYIEKKKKDTNLKITPTHYLGIAIARSLSKHRVLNGMIPFGDYMLADGIDVNFLVAIDQGANFTEITIKNVDKKSLEDVGNELARLSENVRKNKNNQYKKLSTFMTRLPTFIFTIFAYIFGYFSSYLNITFKAFGIRSRHFGSVVISSIGVLGYENGTAPFDPVCYCPFMVTLNKGIDSPYVNEENQITITKIASVSLVFDSRFLNTNELQGFYQDLDFYLSNPKLMEK